MNTERGMQMEEYEVDLEREGEPEDATDAVYVLDGRGRPVRLEVPDDD